MTASAHRLPRPCTTAGVLAGLLLTLPSCTLVQLRQEVGAFESSTVLVGRIDCPAHPAQPVVVAAVSVDTQPPAVVHHTRLHECGGYELMVPAGRYGIVAFADGNGNGRHDPGEALVTHPGPTHATGTGVVMGLDLELQPAGVQPMGGFGGPPAPGLDRLPASNHSTQAGALAELASPLFSAEQASQGYWAPVSFFQRHGGNVYFLEPYDPQRTPVLFVHGAVGSPQDFRSLIERLDRRRYQAWVFHYPSGAALDSMSHLLYWKLLNLQLRYRYNQLAVVAHSMGGLVVRDLLAKMGPELPAPRIFVSISTPWAGEPGAEIGVRHAPAVVPSWHDMRPEGSFVARLFRQPLPSTVEHVLLFGHKGGYSLIRPNTDGTVTLASQLRPEAQAQARRVLGFDEDHMSILASPQVSQVLGAALDQALQFDAAGGGQVQVSLQQASDSARGLPMLRLKPLDGAGAPLALVLAPGDDERPLGPVPPGRYEASLLAAGHTSQPRRQVVDIVAGRVLQLAFTLSPQGMVAGIVGDARDQARLVAGARPEPNTRIRIRSITLRGPGIERRLQPRLDGHADELLERLLDGQDDATASLYAFTRLPAGTYELVFEAEGYHPHRSVHQVVPGRPGPTHAVLMQPL